MLYSHLTQPPCAQYSCARWRYRPPGLHTAMSTPLRSSCSQPPSTSDPSSTLRQPSVHRTNTTRLLSSSSKLSSADAVTNDISTALSTCPSTHYIIISQSGVTANDYSSTSSPRSQIQRLSRDKTTIRSSTIIPDVIGEVDTSRWESTLKTHCNIQVQDLDASTGYIPAYASFPQAVRVTLPAPSTSNRAKDLAENDAFWASLLDMLPSSDYTVLFTTTPSGFTRQPSEPVHEYSMDSDSQQALHTEMKRALHANVVRKNSNETLPEGALFERYQFFTPGESTTSHLHDMYHEANFSLQASTWASSSDSCCS